MPVLTARPQFGGKLNVDSYYREVNAVIKVLRPTASLRIISEHLNGQGFKTPTGLDWNRDRLANHIKTSH